MARNKVHEQELELSRPCVLAAPKRCMRKDYSNKIDVIMALRRSSIEGHAFSEKTLLQVQHNKISKFHYIRLGERELHEI